MLINADFSAPAAVTPYSYQWVASPQFGVERVLLDRVGGEVARATSLVRYAQGTKFPPHKHPGGEEILVLSGTFSDESGDYPAGWYLRNPPGSSHRPHSDPGALILVKLHQMKSCESKTIRINTVDVGNWHLVSGRNVCKLFDDGDEQVHMEKLTDMDMLASNAAGGLELFILSGALAVNGALFSNGSWVRLPAGTHPSIYSVGASMVFVKAGHLNGLEQSKALL